MPTKYIKPERILLKPHPELTEKWVQEIIAQDPSVLGLGDLIVRDKERAQPRAGRLDLLLQDPETKRRYEVEVQLGPTDEAHIIRTIEYWDIERKRYPQYEHCAVIVAENITSRFLNVIALFNGAIPLVAIQMQALKVGDHTTLVFSKVVDELVRGLVDEDEDADAAPTDRAYWEKKASKETVKLSDEVLSIAKQLDPALELRYNKFYIGFSRDKQAFNFAVSRPRKSVVLVDIKLPQTEETDAKITTEGVEVEYESRWGAYRFSMNGEELAKRSGLLKDLMQVAYQLRSA